MTPSLAYPPLALLGGGLVSGVGLTILAVILAPYWPRRRRRF